MFWLAAALVLIFIIWLGITHPRFGLTLLAVVGGLILVTVLWLVNDDRSQKERARRAKTLIAANEVELVDLRLTLGNAIDSLTGRVRNKSTQYVLSGLTLRIQVEDCIEEKCEIVGERSETIHLNVPPGQSRDLSESILLGRLGKPIGKRSWSHRIVEVEGRD